jgi:hypothetical protein
MCNLNIVGQLLRITLGLLLIALTWLGPQTSILGSEEMKLWMLGWFGLIPLISGIVAFCPLYAVFGYNYKQKH